MSLYSEYADRLSEEHSVLRRIDQTPLSWEEGYVPLVARRGPDHARRKLDRFHETLEGARKRAREEQIKRLLPAQPTWDLLWRLPLGKPTPIRDLVERHSRVVLLGEGGAGKTTALRHLAVERPRLGPASITEEAVEEASSLTFLIDLAKVPDLGHSSLPEYLSEDAEIHLSISAAPDFFERILVRGQAVVCVDGLDALPSQREQAQAIKQVESWVSEFPNSHYVVAARPNVYELELSRDDFVHYFLSPWNEAFIDDLEDAWNRELDGWQAEEPDRAYSRERSRFWQDLAWTMRTHDQLSPSMGEAEAWLVEAVQGDKAVDLGRPQVSGEVQALLQQSVPHLSLVELSGGQLRFLLSPLYDLLAARALEARCVHSGVEGAWEAIQDRLGALGWRETIGLFLRFLAQDHSELCESMVQRLLSVDEPEPWEPLLRRRVLLAVSALHGALEKLDQSVRHRVIEPLIGWIGDDEAVGREDAVYALLHLGGQTYAIDRILAIAQDPSQDLWSREAALLALGRLDDLRASESLLAYMEDDQVDVRIQLAAIAALGALYGNPALVAPEREVVVERLIGCMRNPDAAIDLRVAAGEALSLIHRVAPENSIIETLIALARAENDKETPPYSVQVAAAEALGSLVSEGKDAEFAEQMLSLARDSQVSDVVRTRLAEVLGRLGRAEEAAQVLSEIAQDPKVYSRGHRAALEALGRVGYADQAMLDQVVQIARTKDRKVRDFVRLAAAQALNGLGHVDLAIQHLLMLIADKSVHLGTRKDALEYLGHLGATGEADLDAAVVAVLQVWANEENAPQDVRENAIIALRVLRAGEEEIVRDLIAIIQDKGTYARVRRVTATELGRFPIDQKERVVEALGPVFYDPEEKSDLLRVPIARLLFLWGEDEQALAYLRLAAEHSCMAQVRYDAAMVLLEIGEMDLGTMGLLRLAQDRQVSDLIRCAALRALGLWMVDDKEVTLAMTEIARDSGLEPNVREAAYASLRALTV